MSQSMSLLQQSGNHVGRESHLLVVLEKLLRHLQQLTSLVLIPQYLPPNFKLGNKSSHLPLVVTGPALQACLYWPDYTFNLLYFTVPPKISNISSDVTVNEGSNVTLVCMANGRPEPVITWRHLTPTGKQPSNFQDASY